MPVNPPVVWGRAKTTVAQQCAWIGDRNRPLAVMRPCPCGCDQREGNFGVGYITGSDREGNGFTIWIEDEVVFQRVSKLLDCVFD